MKVYYLTNQYKVYYSIVPLCILLTVFVPPMLISSNIWLPLLFIIFGVAQLVRRAIKEHISLSDNGIEYNRPGIIFETKWENIESSGMHWTIAGNQEGFFVDRSKIKLKEWYVGHIRQRVFIPLSCFSNNWRNTELGQQIKQYAPHLALEPHKVTSLNSRDKGRK